MILLADAVRKTVPFPSTKLSFFRPNLVFTAQERTSKYKTFAIRLLKRFLMAKLRVLTCYRSLICLKFVSSLVNATPPAGQATRMRKVTLASWGMNMHMDQHALTLSKDIYGFYSVYGVLNVDTGHTWP